MVRTRTLVELKSILNTVDKMDRFQLVSELAKYSAADQCFENFGYQKLKLKNILLDEILKMEVQNKSYFKTIQESILTELKMRPRMYTCSLVGCRFEASRHRDYVKHIRCAHPRLVRVECKYVKCPRIFSSVVDLIKHIKEEHTLANTTRIAPEAAVEVPVKCNMASCGSKHFGSFRQLMTHFNTSHINDSRNCIFDGCAHQFGPAQPSWKHFRRKHIDTNQVVVKVCHQLDAFSSLTPNETNNNQLSSSVEATDDLCNDYDHYDEADLDDLEDCDIDPTDVNYFLEYHADFLNRLAHEKFVPSSTVQDISEEFLNSCMRSQELMEKKLRKSLTEDLPNETVDKIIDETIKDDFFIKAQEELNSGYKRNKYIKDNFKYVSPVEILLNKSEVDMGLKKDVLHYVPIEESLRLLLEDKTFIEMMELNRSKVCDRDTRKIAHVRDGKLYKTNDFFALNPEALSLLLYSDGVEIVNPLGSARGTYKIVQIFYTLVDIPKHQRSKIDRLQLIMVFREALLKKYSYSVIYKKLVNDLRKLETGIFVRAPEPKLIKVGLLLHAADNLEAHQIGGFSKCFSSNSICRFCHCQYCDLDNHIHDYDGESSHERWSVEEYDNIAQSLMSDRNEETEDNMVAINSQECDDSGSENTDDSDDETNVEVEEYVVENWGVNNVCPLNRLSAFHCVWGLPPDLLHDLLEGVVPEDLCSIIRALAYKGWFTIKEYNVKMKGIGWNNYESRDRPEAVSCGRIGSKLKGKAIRLGFR